MPQRQQGTKLHQGNCFWWNLVFWRFGGKDKFRESSNVIFSILCHRYAAHFRLIVLLLPYFQCYAPKK